MILIIYLGCSLFWSPGWSIIDALQLWLRIALCFCFIAAAADSIRAPGMLRLLSRTVTVCVMLSAVLCILLWFHSPPEDGRLTGLFRLNNPGKAGRMYAAALPFLLAGYCCERGRWRLLVLCAVPVTLVAITLTDTRSAWLGALLGVLTYAIAGWKRTPGAYLGVLAACCSLLLAMIVIAMSSSHPEVSRAVFPRGDSFRLLIWSEHIQAILSSSIWLGEGYLAEYYVEAHSRVFRGAHSMYLSTAFQAGLVGLMLFLALLLVVGQRLLQHLDSVSARLGLSLLVTGASMFVFDGDRLIDKLNVVWFTVWLPLAIALALPRQKAVPAE